MERPKNWRFVTTHGKFRLEAWRNQRRLVDETGAVTHEYRVRRKDCAIRMTRPFVTGWVDVGPGRGGRG